MRSLALPAAVATAALAALAGCGGHRDAVTDACTRAGFAGGSSAADGVFFAVVPRPCSGTGETVCEVADGTGPIDREVVAAGIDQDCVAFNQFVGAGFNAIPGYVTGECFGVARVGVRGWLQQTTRLAPRHCRVGQPRSTDRGPPPPPMIAPGPARAAIRALALDPWYRAPNTGGVGDRPVVVPPWALLVWTGRDGSRCYEPGQYIDARTPGRSDQLPGVAPKGRLRRSRMVGPLRYDARSAPGVQLYGIGRFNPYPRAEGGSCGDPDGPAGIVFSWETEVARRDLNLGVTTIAGLAGPRVRSVEVGLGGRRRPLPIVGGAFLGVLRGDVAPDELPVTVRYRDGRATTFRAEAGRVGPAGPR
jgi:hypothetical protein